MEWDQWLSHRMRMGRPHFYPFLEVLTHAVKGWWTLRSPSEDILQKTSQLSSFLSTPMLISWSFPSLSHCVSFLTALSLFSFSFFPFFFFFGCVVWKGRGTRDQTTNICWIIETAREVQKNIYFHFIDYAKAFDCMNHNKLENSERDGNIRPPDLPLEKSVCRSGSNS